MTTPTDAEVKELSERLRVAWMQFHPTYFWPTIAARYVLERYELRSTEPGTSVGLQRAIDLDALDAAKDKELELLREVERAARAMTDESRVMSEEGAAMLNDALAALAALDAHDALAALNALAALDRYRAAQADARGEPCAVTKGKP
jgi:hypothetical protein